MGFIDFIKRELKFQRHLYDQFNNLQKIEDHGELSCDKLASGYRRFFIKEKNSGRKKYVHRQCADEMQRVFRLQLKGIGKFGAERIGRNITLLEKVILEYIPCDMGSILNALPEELKPDVGETGCSNIIKNLRHIKQSEKPERREELRHTTSFGLLTRSKNEALIAELLYAAGIEFYYEKRLVLIDENGCTKVVYPDFTIIGADGRTIYWEHKGLLLDNKYEEMDRRRMRLYHLNGIFQPRNLIVTADGPQGEFCGTEIALIVEKLLVPMTESRF